MKRVALVTGGARGIGAAIVSRLIDSGYAVAVADKAYAAFETTAGLFRGPCDVRSRQSVEHFIAAATEICGPVDILVNNAGFFPMQPFEKITADDWNEVMAVNLTSVFNTCQCLLPGMRARGWGRVINIASNSFFMGVPALGHYIASKGAVIGLTRSLAAEYGAFGITANCIAPNFTRTEGSAPIEAMAPDVVAQTLASQCIPRMALPDDVAGAVLFLASDQSAFMTGQTLIVDGGTIKS